MVKPKIEWSFVASSEFMAILDFYNKRNGTKVFSGKLHKNVQKTIKLLVKQPEIGVKTNSNNVRVIFERNLSIFYEVLEERIIIHSIWDHNKNPEDCRFEK